MALKKLGKDTIQLVSSSQVITSAHSLIKELVENALDAKASNIDVRLENFGLDLIQVRDNGTGIRKTDVPFMATPHYTSKLSSFQELSSLTSYGFRGEALSSIANVADLSVTTATKDDELAHTYTIDHSGHVVDTKPSSLGVGTTVTVTNLFKNFPVRKRVYKNTKRCNEDLKKVEQILLAFGLAFPSVRFSLKHNKIKLWDKEQAIDLKSNISLIFGPVLSQQLMPVNYQCFNPMVKLQVYVPKPSADLSLVTRSKPDRLFTLVNSRPVEVKAISKIVREAFTEAFPSQMSRFPVAVVIINVLPEEVDVNLEPNKTSVLLHNMDFIVTTISSLLTQAYGPCRVVTPTPEETSPSKLEVTCRQKLDSHCSDHSIRQENASIDPLERRNHGDDLHTVDTHHSDPPQRQHINNPPQHRDPPQATGISNQPPTSCTHHTDPLGTQHNAPLEKECGLPNSLTSDPPQSTNISNQLPPSITTSSFFEQQHSPCGTPSQVDNVPPTQSPPTNSENTNKDNDLTVDIESYSLLDISELEKDFVSSSEEEMTVEQTEGPAVTRDKNGEACSATEQVAGGRQVSLLSWSRGEALTDAAKKPVEPVRILSTVAPKVTEQSGTAAQSKLNLKKPSGVFDMVHSRPVKRAVGSSFEGDRPAKKAKDLSSPSSLSLDQFLTRPEQEPSKEASEVQSSELCFELDKIARRNESLWKRDMRPRSSDQVVGSCQCPQGDMWIVLLKGTLAKFNINRLAEASSHLTLSKTEVEDHFKKTLKDTNCSSVDMLTKTPFFQGIHTIDKLKNN